MYVLVRIEIVYICVLLNSKININFEPCPTAAFIIRSAALVVVVLFGNIFYTRPLVNKSSYTVIKRETISENIWNIYLA